MQLRQQCTQANHDDAVIEIMKMMAPRTRPSLLSLALALLLLLLPILTEGVFGLFGNAKPSTDAAAAADGNEHSANADAANHHRRHNITAASFAKAKKLLEMKNINRGAEGTVVKDLDRGPPLKDKLPEDGDDEVWSDDHWYEGEEDLVYEEKQLLGQQQQQQTEEAKDEVKSEIEDETKEEVKNAAATATIPTTIVANLANATKPATTATTTTITAAATATTTTPKQQPKAAAATKTTTKAKPKRKYVPRVWETNDRAVMKIIDKDAYPNIEIGPDGKIKHHRHNEDDEDEDSSDDEEEAKKTANDHTKYLALPNLANLSPNDAARQILSPDNGISHPLQQRLSTMFQKAKTHECRVKIAEHMALFVNGLAEETKFPFEDFYFPNTCEAMARYADWENLPSGVTIQQVQYRVYKPPKDTVPEGTYLENVNELQLLYVILTHDQPESTIRLIESVYVPDVTRYVIHVDGKEAADPTYHRLVEYAVKMNDIAINTHGKEEYIRIVPNENRVRVNWGGFTMVKATLMALRTVFGLDYYDKHPGVPGKDAHDNPHAFTFHKLVHLASTTYPLASNTEIRETLASHPLDANFLHIILRPNNPSPSVWNYFVECDDALHRIYRIPPLMFERGNGIDIYTSSQWFIISREFAWYLASPPKESFVEYYLKYIEHVVVADEAFFGTVIRNTHFCATLHNDNFLHLQFDRWENEATGGRDQRKCIMRNPDHCGRSPTTMTVDYLPVLELSGDLFARKFDDNVEPHIKDYIDLRRQKDEERLKREAELTKDSNGTEVELPLEEWEFQGEGVLIVAKETLQDDIPLCLGLAKEGNAVGLQPCFKNDVPPTLSPGWETGAVIIEEIEGYNRWDIGPCSSDGELKRNATGELEMVPGVYSEKGPSCGIKIGDGPRRGRCLDVESERTQPGGYLNVYPCSTKWHQLFSFGNGTIAPRGAIHASLPLHMARQLEKKEKVVHPHLCLGVFGRGDADESAWIEDEDEDEPWDPWEYGDVERYPNGRKSLQLWSGHQLQSTPCSNVGGVIEWYYVPFIVEEYEEDEKTEAEGENAGEESEEEL